MPEKCPVNAAINDIDEIIKSGAITNPKSRLWAEEILQLLRDIAWGRAGKEHIPALESLAKGLTAPDQEKSSAETGQKILSSLSENTEIFSSHVKTHNCPTRDCLRLAPAPCQMACPAGIDVPTYVALIAGGHDAEAIEVIRKDNPFPWICGLVCTRPCEFMCVRGRMDTPVSIKYLKAFAAERAMSERRYKNPEKEPDKNRKVCITGAGPAGLSAAYYLALKGYAVTVLESLPVAGGMMMVGIPRYRLPREIIDREIAMLEELGVQFRYNTKFGKDITIDLLKNEGYEAFFLAIGAHGSIKLGIKGEENFPQVYDSIELLRNVALGNRHIPGNRVLVIGGGNVAIDAARTCLRLGSEEVGMLYRRTRSEMPADIEEVEQAEEEGVKISFLTVPVEIIGNEGKLTGIRCLKAKLVQAEGSKRKTPVPVEGSDFFIEADIIITAIGQKVENRDIGSLTGLEWTRRSTLDVNLVTMETSIEGIFAAGDAVSGPATVIEAIGGGKKAADSIDRYLSGIPQPKMPPVPVRRGRIECTEVSSTTRMILKRPVMPLLNIDRRRTTFQQVELGYPENAVREEARRCLRCDICLRCGKCVEICRDKMKINALEFGHLDFDHPVRTDFRRTEEKCILCGACAANCPTGAMEIEDRNGERILSLCGTILNRQKLNNCSSCGSVIGPERYIDYVRQRADNAGRIISDRILCDSCARDKSARYSSEMPVQ
jgi:NADPH-dependent glutamate synthase beta subunit-like oxidoreductase